MKRVFFLSLVICMAFSLASCSLKASWDMAGKWQKVDGNETLEFARNGMVTFVNGPTTLTTPYKFADAKRMLVELGSLGSMVVETAVVKDTLTLTDAKGKVSKFQKVK